MSGAIRGRRTRVGDHVLFSRIGRPEISPSYPAIVFVHGLMVAGGYLRPTLDRLADRYAVAAPDLPGFGASDKPSRSLSVEELAEALDAWTEKEMPLPVVVVGCSMGTQIAAELASRRPDLVAGLVLLGPVMDPEARSVPAAMLRWARELPYELGQVPLTVRDYARGGLRRAQETFGLMLRFPIEDRLPRLTMPVLVVRGGRDPIVSRRWGTKAASLAPRGRYLELPCVAHSANFTAPERFAAVVDDFVTRLGSSQAEDRPPDRDSVDGRERALSSPTGAGASRGPQA